MTIKIEKKQFDNIATWMKPVQQTNLPDVLKGVFFMDGNPLPDDCITMYNLGWDAENKTLFLPVFGEVQWTFQPSIQGRILLIGAWIARFTYKIQFEDEIEDGIESEKLKRSQITPFAFGIKIPRWILSATMCQKNDSDNGDIWVRKNIWFGIIPKIGDYTLRRIVNEDGSYTPAFQDMLTKVDQECLIIAPNYTKNDIASNTSPSIHEKDLV
ncbi:MAG: hypothetical protein AAF378_12950 [Cyanobacteria bacterium P01_A01_bin.84]